DTARLAHENSAGGDVPYVEVAFPIAVEAAGGDISEIKRRGAEAADAGRLCDHTFYLRKRNVMPGFAVERRAAGKEGVTHVIAARDAQAPIVEVSALAFLGPEQFVAHNVIDNARDQHAFALKPDRDGEMRDAVQKVGGAVERIDKPAIGFVGAFDDAALFHDEAIAGARFRKLLEQGLLSLDVGGGHKVARALARHLQVLNLAEITRQRTRGLA